MAIDRSIWQTFVDKDFSNSYPCPRCNKGQVRRGDNPVVLVEPHHSQREHGLEEWDPDWIQMSFTTMLTCDNATCGEVVAVSGRAGVDHLNQYEYEGEPEGSRYYEFLRPVSLFPAPPLFPVAKNLPEKVKNQLALAFQLFWADRSASTSRLRTGLERILDDQGVPATGTNKNGKPRRLDLFERIELFKNATNDADVAESMDAVRVVGNLGTHGNEVTEGDYFNLIDVYEDALAEIYGQETAKLKAKKAALIALKK